MKEKLEKFAIAFVFVAALICMGAWGPGQKIAANQFVCGPATGAAAAGGTRAIVEADIGANTVNLAALKDTQTVPKGGTGAVTLGTSKQPLLGNGTAAVTATTAPTTADALADVIYKTSATTQKALVLQGTAGQTANVFEYQQSTGTVDASIDPQGTITGRGVKIKDSTNDNTILFSTTTDEPSNRTVLLPPLVAATSTLPVLNVDQTFTGVNTMTGNVNFSGNADLALASGSDLTLSGFQKFTAYTNAQFTANQDDLVLSGMINRVSTDASRNLTGIVNPGGISRTLVIVNVGSNDLVLKHETTSTAANRLTCSTGADITISANDAADLFYDNTTARWRVFKRIDSTSGTQSASYMVEADSNGPGSATYQTGANESKIFTLDDGSTKGVVFSAQLPSNLSLSANPTLTFQIFPTAAVATNDVRLQVTYSSLADGALADAADEDTEAQNVAISATAGTLKTVTVTMDASLMTAGDFLRVRIQRIGADAADTYAGQIGIVKNVRISYTGS